MLTLENFETQISSSIVERGKQYFKQGAVTYLEKDQDYTWHAEVAGSEDYSVTVQLNKKHEIKEYDCDCPYDGSTCKHVVAVLHVLRAQIKETQNKTTKAGSKKDLFGNLLKVITLAEYQQFIKQYAAKDRNFKTAFELYFAEKDDRIDVQQKYETLLQGLIRKHSSRGFIDYRATHQLAKEVTKLLQTGHDFLQKQNYRDALTLAGVVMKDMMEAIMAADDSNGNLAGTIAEAIELLEAMVSAPAMARDMKEEIFLFLETELHNKTYFSYDDFGYDLFNLYQKLAIDLNKADAYLNFVKGQIQSLRGPYEEYRREYFQVRQIAFLEATGKTAEAENLIQEHLFIVDVRQAEVEKAIAQQNYKKAKQLIADGIAIARNKNHPGTVDGWEKQLLRIAGLEKDITAIRYYSQRFAFDRNFDSQYYKQWKGTYSPAEWPRVIQKFIQDTTEEVTRQWHENKKSYWNPPHPPVLDKLGPVFIAEKQLDRLLALVKQANNLATTFQYHAYLVAQYPEELLALYLPALEKYGHQANGRGEYVKLASGMKKVMQDIPAGKEKIQALAQNLKATYPRRPAMLEELNNVLQ